MDDLASALNDNENILQATFGDNVTVIVTRDGVDTEEYDCGY